MCVFVSLLGCVVLLCLVVVSGVLVLLLFLFYLAGSGWRWLALAMLPALGSAMAACTWHLFDNPDDMRGLVVFQAALTTLGNAALALAAWNLLRQQRRQDACEAAVAGQRSSEP